MGVWWQLGIGVIALWLVLRFVLRLISIRKPSESLDEPLVEDPFAGVPSPKRRGPKDRNSAVALEEPDEEDEGRTFPPYGL